VHSHAQIGMIFRSIRRHPANRLIHLRSGQIDSASSLDDEFAVGK